MHALSSCFILAACLSAFIAVPTDVEISNFFLLLPYIKSTRESQPVHCSYLVIYKKTYFWLYNSDNNIAIALKCSEMFGELANTSYDLYLT